MSAALPVERTEQQLPTSHASESAAILSVIERMALNPDISPERVERFIALKRQVDADAAKKEFDAAVADAKAELTPIVKNRDGHNSKYADLGAVATAVDPIISKFGLSYRHRAAQTDRITVTCVLSHKAGHSEDTSLSGPADTSGAKNAIQSIGSTLTYLQRYTLLLALGLATAMPQDDDGKSAGIGDTITDEQFDALSALMDQHGADLAKFCAYFKIDKLPDLPASKYAQAETMIKAKRK